MFLDVYILLSILIALMDLYLGVFIIHTEKPDDWALSGACLHRSCHR